MTGASFAVTVWFLLKILTIVGTVIYAGFAAVMVRQERLMASVLEEQFEPVIRILVFVHLAASLGMIALAFILL